MNDIYKKDTTSVQEREPDIARYTALRIFVRLHTLLTPIRKTGRGALPGITKARKK